MEVREGTEGSRGARQAAVEMSGHGRGSINHKLDTWREAGKHEELALQLLGSAVDALENAKENMRPNKLRKARQEVDMAAEKAAVALQVVQQTAHAWQGAARVNYAVRAEVTEMRRAGLTDETVVQTLQEYKNGASSGDKSCPTQVGSMVDCGTSIRGAYEVRQRVITVDGHEIMAPSRGAWYQTSEAVRILYDLRQRNIRISKKVVEVWRSKTPPLIDLAYQVLMRHVKRVEDDVTRNKCTVDESITRLISDRTAVNLAPLAGRPRFMSKSQFVAGVLDSKKREESSNKHVALQVLNDAKTESYAQRGLRPPKACVHPNTVRNYWQHLGDKENKIRTKVSDRSHARVQASRSIMHLFSYFFTILHTHVLVAPLGMGKEPSPDNWAALLLRRFYRAPIMPVDPGCLLNSDTKTVGVKLNPTGKDRLHYYVVRAADEHSGKVRSYWREGADSSEPWVFIESFDVMSADCRWGTFCWVGGA